MSRIPPPLVSVVVPAFNHAGLVEECLRSVAAQTYRPLELIVVDDASRDGTADVVERLLAEPGFASFAVRTHLERHASNVGAHEALRSGLSLATGEWLAILNSDDRYAPERLAILMRAALSRHAAMVFSTVRYIDREGADVTRSDALAAKLARSQRAIRSQPSVGFALLRENVAISTGNLLFRRDLLARVGGFRPLRYCHDWDFLLRCVLHTEPAFVDAPLYDYRLHEANSFRSLGDVADAESQECLRTYFAAVRRNDFDSWVAPAPATWPRVFERFVAENGLERAWLGATSVQRRG